MPDSNLQPTLGEELRGQRFGVVLSAGYFGFFGHAGLLTALEAEALVPAGWAGTSAGALVAAMGASGMAPAAIHQLMTSVSKADFWDPAPLSQLWDGLRGRKMTGLLKGDAFRKLLEQRLPKARFEDCQVPLVIVTSDLTRAASRIHDAGALAPAIAASCAYPGLFRTVDEDDAQLWDGGLIDKAPLVALTERVQVSAVLVMYLQSDSQREATARPKRHGFVGGLAQGLSAVRHEHFVLQAKLLEARGIAVYQLSPDLPRLGPNRLHLGEQAHEESRRYCTAALTSACQPWRRYRA